jgi:hypothetical protein
MIKDGNDKKRRKKKKKKRITERELNAQFIVIGTFIGV